MPWLARASVALALAFLLSGGCGGRERVARPVEIAVPPAAQYLDVSGDVELERCSYRLHLERGVALNRSRDGTWTVRPISVKVTGLELFSLPDVAPPLSRDGSFSLEGMQRLAGIEGPAQAARNLRVGASWAAARGEEDVLSCGYPLLGDGVLLPRLKAIAAAADPWPDTVLDDPRHFLLAAPADLDLAAVLPLIAGTWQGGEERERTFTVRPASAGWDAKGHATLKRTGRETKYASLSLRIAWQGEDPETPGGRYERTTDGHLTVDPDGHIRMGTLKTEVRLEDGSQASSFRATFDVRVARASAPEAAAADRADARLGRLLALRASDREAYYQALLDETAALARKHLLVLREGAVLDDVPLRVGDARVLREVEESDDYRPDSSVGIASRAHGAWFDDGARIFGVEVMPAKEDRADGSDAEAGDDAPAPLPLGGWFYEEPLQILVMRGSVTNLMVVAHEYAHLAAARFGYEDRARLGLEREPFDYAWVDADGIAAAAALEEAQAEASGWAAALGLEYTGEVAQLLEWWGANVPDVPPRHDMDARLARFAYRMSPLLLDRRHVAGDALEDVIARTWKHFSYQTREILFPDTEPKRSGLWPRALQLEGEGAKGASRIGAWGLLQWLECWIEDDRETTLSLVRGLEDDLLVRGERGVLWVAHWADAEAAEAFAEHHRSWIGALHVKVEGAVLVATSGDVPEAAAWIAHLTPER